jgi:hypothetical protein
MVERKTEMYEGRFWKVRKVRKNREVDELRRGWNEIVEGKKEGRNLSSKGLRGEKE